VCYPQPGTKPRLLNYSAENVDNHDTSIQLQYHYCYCTRLLTNCLSARHGGRGSYGSAAKYLQVGRVQSPGTGHHVNWYTTLKMEVACSVESHTPIYTASYQHLSQNLIPRALSMSHFIRQRCKVAKAVTPAATAWCVLRLQVKRRSQDMKESSITSKKHSRT
jgi:hypothetical protein